MVEPTHPVDVATLQRELAHLAGFVRGYMAARGLGPVHGGTAEQWPYYGFGVSDGQAWARKTPQQIREWRDAGNWHRGPGGELIRWR